MWTLYPQSAHVLAIALTRRRHLDTDVIVVVISANIGAETPLPATTDSCSALYPRDTPYGVTTPIAKSARTPRPLRAYEHEYRAGTEVAITTWA